MQEMDMDVSLKVIVVGNGMVGKTSMITRFARGIMTENYKKTIGTDFMEKEITVRSSGEAIKLMLWDTAGQEMFSQLTRNYYRGAGAVVYVFSTTDRDSFLEIEKWKGKVEAECGTICQVLVQNKIDLLDKSSITSNEVEDLSRRMGCKLYRTCVKDNVLVDEVFDYLADTFLKQGGSSAFGVESVTSIGDVQAAPSSSNSNAGSNNGGAGSSNGGAAAAAKNPEPAAANAPSASFQLTPLTVRTEGKKKSFCTIL